MHTHTDRAGWLNWVLTTSIPLCFLDADAKIIPSGSAALLAHGNRKFLLSVEHAVPMHSADRMAYLRAAPNGGSELYRIGAFNYLAKIADDASGLSCLDFGFVEVDASFEPVYQHRTPLAISDERPRHIFATSAASLPATGVEYAFSGRIRPELHGGCATVTATAYYSGLRFLRTEGPFHVFSLPVRHPGHDAFQGCSGAPIVDVNENFVALLIGGDEASNTVHGVAADRYLYGIDHLCSLRA
jgi:hypothetical protein